jgi:hypothetical protein
MLRPSFSFFEPDKFGGIRKSLADLRAEVEAAHAASGPVILPTFPDPLRIHSLQLLLFDLRSRNQREDGSR